MEIRFWRECHIQCFLHPIISNPVGLVSQCKQYACQVLTQSSSSLLSPRTESWQRNAIWFFQKEYHVYCKLHFINCHPNHNFAGSSCSPITCTSVSLPDSLRLGMSQNSVLPHCVNSTLAKSVLKVASNWSSSHISSLPGQRDVREVHKRISGYQVYSSSTVMT